MVRDKLTPKDRERFARARAVGQAHAQDPSSVTEARYDYRNDMIGLHFRGGGSMSIPRHMVPGLRDVAESAVRQIDVSPAGDALAWPLLDVQVYIPGLVEEAFGRRLFAAATGQRGGRRRSKAKASAARSNGAKGGRPRKRRSA